MMNERLIANQYTHTYQIVTRLTAGMTHEESLLQFPFGANCLNWLAGHITVARLNLLAILGDKETIWDFGQARRYIPGSAPIVEISPDVTRLDDILLALGRSQHRLEEALLLLTEDDLAAKLPDNAQSLGATLLYYAQHEAFHTGQIEICRLLAGKPHVPGFE